MDPKSEFHCSKFKFSGAIVHLKASFEYNYQQILVYFHKDLKKQYQMSHMIYAPQGYCFILTLLTFGTLRGQVLRNLWLIIKEYRFATSYHDMTAVWHYHTVPDSCQKQTFIELWLSVRTYTK